jgi:hypothetical protein
MVQVLWQVLALLRVERGEETLVVGAGRRSVVGGERGIRGRGQTEQMRG